MTEKEVEVCPACKHIIVYFDETKRFKGKKYHKGCL